LDKRDTLRGSISHRETVSPRKKKSVSHFSKSSSLKNLPNNKEKKGGSFYISTKKEGSPLKERISPRSPRDRRTAKNTFGKESNSRDRGIVTKIPWGKDSSPQRGLMRPKSPGREKSLLLDITKTEISDDPFMFAKRDDINHHATSTSPRKVDKINSPTSPHNNTLRDKKSMTNPRRDVDVEQKLRKIMLNGKGSSSKADRKVNRLSLDVYKLIEQSEQNNPAPTTPSPKKLPGKLALTSPKRKKPEQHEEIIIQFKERKIETSPAKQEYSRSSDYKNRNHKHRKSEPPQTFAPLRKKLEKSSPSPRRSDALSKSEHRNIDRHRSKDSSKRDKPRLKRVDTKTKSGVPEEFPSISPRRQLIMSEDKTSPRKLLIDMRKESKEKLNVGMDLIKTESNEIPQQAKNTSRNTSPTKQTAEEEIILQKSFKRATSTPSVPVEFYSYSAKKDEAIIKAYLKLLSNKCFTFGVKHKVEEGNQTEATYEGVYTEDDGIFKFECATITGAIIVNGKSTSFKYTLDVKSKAAEVGFYTKNKKQSKGVFSIEKGTLIGEPNKNSLIIQINEMGLINLHEDIILSR